MALSQGDVNSGFESEEETEGQHHSSPPVTTSKENEEPKRQQWNNKREFLLACISMCVGMGNVWRFGFVALENGGGAFLIPYIIVLVVIGKPMYYLEFILGQFCSSGVIGMWEICPAFRGVGYGQAFCNWIMMTYFVSVMALCMFYFFASFSSVLPWAVCGPWASLGCVPVHANTTSLLNAINTTLIGEEMITSSEDYFLKEVLKMDPEGFQNGLGMPDLRLSLCLLLSWVLLFVVQVKGVHSSGRSAYFTALFPYVVLLIMFIRGVTLPGSLQGILFFLTPRWEKLLDLEVWSAAVNQAFYSLGVGFGVVLTYASYNPFRNNLYVDATIISYLDGFTSVFAGITTFAILGHLADQLGVEVQQVLRGGGLSLAFVSYAEAVARFTYLPQVFSAMFFLMMFTLGFGCVLGYNNVIITIISDTRPGLPTWPVTLGSCVVGFLVGLLYNTPQGQFIIILVSHYSDGIAIILLMVLELVGVVWIYGMRRLARDIRFMLDRSTGLFWRMCWSVLSPLFLAVVFIYSQAQQQVLTYGTYVFDNIANGVGLVVMLIAVGVVPLMFLKEVMSRYDASKGLWQALTDAFTVTSEWSPKDPELRRQYLDLLVAEAEANHGSYTGSIQIATLL